ncbi:MAG TPA: flagellar basal body P-ring formation chaperone FlgA [Steroidobacteraceae bacterium]|jgi:flagella basal body P-ring formation protein FlgA|nr:flagellar basal body P-ring formation chaperone FlgA [Steroidobacteraceae bacterium]
MTTQATDIRRGLALLALLAVLPTLSLGAGVMEPVERIEAAAHSYVQSLLPPGSAQTQITVLSLDRRLRLAHCDSALAAQLPPGSNLAARATVSVSCAGPTHWTIYVPVVVESRIPVLVLRHAVERDARLTAADVAVETRRTAGIATAYLSAASELAGRTVRRPLAVGTALSVEMFAADMVIHRGQQVTLVAGSPDLEIRASGRALMDAPAGARIQVQNLSSLTVVEGVVESADVVRVAL